MAFVAMLLCTSSAWAETLYFAFGGGTVSNALVGDAETAESPGNETWTSTEHAGYSWAITGNPTRSISGGNKVNATPYYEGYLTGFKNSNGAQNTFYMPEGVKISNIKFIGYTNKAKADGKTCTLQEINGVTVTENNTLDVYTDDVVNKQVENPGVIDYTFPEPVSGSFTFKMGSQQGCFIIVIETVEEETPVEPEVPAGPVVYTMVQNEADLVAGGKYLIMAEVTGGWVALSDQNGKYRTPSDTLSVTETYTVETTVANVVDESPAVFGGVAYELTLEGSTGAWKFKDELNGAYLHWASGNSVINDAEGSVWTIEFNQYAHNAVIAHATTADRVLLYNANKGQERFACYTSAQKPVYLFKAGEVTVAPVAPSNPSFNTIAELLAFEVGNVVDLNVNKAKITYLSGNNMSITDGVDTLAVYDYNIPADYAVGGWLSGKITATLGEYKGNKQLTVVDWEEVTFVAPVTVESPWVGAVAESGATYYFYNPAAKAFLKAGNSWGTRASFGQDAYPVILEGGNNVYALSTTLTFEGKYMRPDLFMDQNKTDFTFNEVGEGVYTIYLASNGYVAYTGVNTVEYAAEVNDGCYWQLLTADAIKEQMLAADAYNPYDVTALIPGANFGRNNAQNSAWTAINTNAYDNAGGANNGDNNNQQVWSAGLSKISQVLTGLPNGTYLLNAQAFYRLGGVAEAAAARTAGTEVYDVKLFANTDSVMVMSVMDEAGKLDVGSDYGDYGKAPNNQSQARDFFTAGYYDHVIYFTVTDGTANIGIVKNSSVGADWLVFDNFRLTYYGTASVEDVKLAVPRKAFLDRYTAMEQFSQESMNFMWNGINNTYFWPVLDEAMAIKDTIDNVTDLALLDSMKTEMDKAEEMVLKAYALVDEYNKVKNLFWDASDNSTAINDEVRMAMEAALENSNYASYTIATIKALEAAIADLKAEYIAYVSNAVANEGYMFDVTCMLVNPSFETGDLTGWTIARESADTGVRTNSGNYATEGIDGTHLFNSWWNGVLLSQEVVGLPNGKYTLTIAMAGGDAGNDATAYIIANTDTMGLNLGNPGVFVDYSLNVEVTSQKLYVATIGGNDDDTAENPIGSFNPDGYWWYKADNFRLYYAGVEKPAPKGPKVAYLCGATESTEAIYNALVAADYNVTALNYDDVSLTEEIVANDFVGKYDVVVLAGGTGSSTKLAATYTALLGKVPVFSTKSFWYPKTTPAGTKGTNPGTADAPSRFLVKTVAEHPIFGGIAGDTITVFNDMAKSTGRYLQGNGTFANNEPAQTTLGTANGDNCIGEAWFGDMGWLIIPVDGAQPEGYLTEAGKALFVNAVAYLVAGEKYEAPVVEVATVTLDKTKAELTEAGATVQLTATVAPENATDKAITWTSSDEKVATVDANGLVTAVANGTATITATAANGVKAECVITVKIAVVDGIEAIEAVENAVIYTITGKAVQGDVKTLERGIYIINGKKVLVK